MSFFNRQKQEAEFQRELKFHIDERTRELIAQGLSPEEAHRRASVELGGQEQTAQQLREVHSSAILETTWRNLRSGFRLVKKSPGFALAVILTLALGIGANSAVFSAINAVLLKPLPYPHGDQLMTMTEQSTKSADPPTFVAPVRLEDWNRMNSTFQAISGYYTQSGSELSGPLPEKIEECLVAPRFLKVLGVLPALGRDFSDAEYRNGGPNAVLISDAYWRRHFHADPNAVGKQLKIGSSANTIIGVMPASFAFPSRDVDIWSSVPTDAPYAQSRESTWFSVIGRVKPGVTLAQARADLATVQAQLGTQFPKTDSDLRVQITAMKEETVGSVRRSLWMLFGSVTILLLIACTNIVALLLARITERQHEISVRFSLGASRGSLIAQLLTETFVLALLGSALGLAIAASAAKVFRMLAADLPRVQEITLDWQLAGYTLLCALAATFLCGLLPALGATRTLSASLAEDRRTHVSERNPIQWTLVGVQVALAVTLLFGAGLLLRSFQELSRVSLGFDPSHVLTLHISAGWGETTDMKALAQRINKDLDAIRAVPGVEAAATTVALPGVPGDYDTEVKITDSPQDPNRKIRATGRFTSDGYFSVLQIPMIAGEPCAQNWTTPSIMVNRSFAERNFAGGLAMGHHLLLGEGSPFAATAEIRGVVADARENGAGTEPRPTVYWCINNPMPDPHYIIRTKLAPAAMANTIRQAIRQAEPARAVFDISPLEDHLSDAYAENRLRTILLSLFALTAVSLACVGLYGTLSYSVTVRRREIGLRLALGAIRTQITKRYVFQALRVAATGCACGLVLAAFAGRLLSGMLYGVSSLDVVTFSGVIALVLTVAALAAIIPAWRASRTDPMHVLREQ